MEENTTQTAVETTTPDSTTNTPAVSGNDERTFTQADVNRIVAERVAREKAAQEEARKSAEAKAKMDAETRAQAEKAEAEQRAQEAEQRAKLASYRADLKGEVVDVDAALRLVDDEKHVKDGAVDVKSLLKSYPFLAPARSTAPGAGGVQGTGQPDTSTLAGAMAADGIKL